MARELGCLDTPVNAEFYKLLVYETGGFFLAHRDSEKAGGMFGTLVVTLPCEHTGGELCVRHAGREVVLDLRPAETAEIRYAALARALRTAASAAGCEPRLALVHIEESGWAEYTGYGKPRRGRRWDEDEDEDNDDDFEIGEVTDGDRYIDTWRTPDETAAGDDLGRIPLEDDELLPRGALDGEDPDQVHFSEATGNEGASFERTYLRAALVLWPRARTDALLLSAGYAPALAALARRAEETAAPSGRDSFARLARLIVDRWAAGVTPHEHAEFTPILL